MPTKPRKRKSTSRKTTTDAGAARPIVEAKAKKKPRAKTPKALTERKLTKAKDEVVARRAERAERKATMLAVAAAKREEADRARRKAAATLEAEHARREARLRKASTSSGATSRLSVLVAVDRLRGIARRHQENLKLAALPKPPYLIPTMAEIDAAPTGGLKVVSMFSGCGGASLGLRMAGFKVVHANEFIAVAAESYRANNPETFVDPRDVRLVTAEEIIARTGIAEGDFDVVEASPPCASFSLSGKRDKLWGQVKNYSETKQRVDDLFFEFVRILGGLMPKVVLAENVPGLGMTKATGVLAQIMAAIRGLGYKAEARILSAAEHGVPQVRRRLIIQGVRDDLGLDPAWPDPLPYRYLVRDAWNNVPVGEKIWCGRYRVGKLWETLAPGEEHEVRFNLKRMSLNQVGYTITQNMGNDKGACKYPAQVMHPSECRYLTIPEVKRLCSFPDDYKLVGTFSQQYERLGRAVPPLLYKRLGDAIRERVLKS